jgi:hypothetical protein
MGSFLEFERGPKRKSSDTLMLIRMVPVVSLFDFLNISARSVLMLGALGSLPHGNSARRFRVVDS